LARQRVLADFHVRQPHALELQGVSPNRFPLGPLMASAASQTQYALPLTPFALCWYPNQNYVLLSNPVADTIHLTSAHRSSKTLVPIFINLSVKRSWR